MANYRCVVPGIGNLLPSLPLTNPRMNQLQEEYKKEIKEASRYPLKSKEHKKHFDRAFELSKKMLEMKLANPSLKGGIWSI